MDNKASGLLLFAPLSVHLQCVHVLYGFCLSLLISIVYSYHLKAGGLESNILPLLSSLTHLLLCEITLAVLFTTVCCGIALVLNSNLVQAIPMHAGPQVLTQTLFIGL